MLLMIFRVAENSVFQINSLMFTYFADTKLKEYDVNENSVLEILTQVNIFKREAELVR